MTVSVRRLSQLSPPRVESAGPSATSPVVRGGLMAPTWRDEYTLSALVWEGLGMTVGEFRAAGGAGELAGEQRPEVLRAWALLRKLVVPATACSQRQAPPPAAVSSSLPAPPRGGR